MHCVILSKGRWHSHSVCQIPWTGIGTEEEEEGPPAAAALGSAGLAGQQQLWQHANQQFLLLFLKKSLFKAKPRPRNDFCHRTWHWTQQQARIRIIRGCYITGLSCSFLLYTQKAHTSEIVSISTHLCYFPSVKLAFGSCSQDLSVGSLKFKSVQVKSRKPK